MVESRELPFFGALNLRVDPRNAAAAQDVAETLGMALPKANTWVAASGATVLWQAYDEWLLVTPDGREQALAGALRKALSSTHHAITDVSDLRVAFSLRGPHARDVLQKGCAVDLHPRAFGAGSCVTAALARIRVTLRQTDAMPAYELLAERSYAPYLRDWLADAALEYAA